VAEQFAAGRYISAAIRPIRVAVTLTEPIEIHLPAERDLACAGEFQVP
jgi:hypothetical protein